MLNDFNIILLKMFLDTKEKLKNSILKKEEVKSLYQEKFEELALKVKSFLQKQDSFSAIKEITQKAIEFWSSDLHFDNTETNIIVRFRIDGLLNDIFFLEKKEYKLILERVKHSSNLKLNITNIPQDWKYFLDLNWKKIDVRVSTLPTAYWENIVCRVLDTEKNIIDFEDLWFMWTTKRFLERAINKKNGMILITWPTWSWKTTTLYTILNRLNKRSVKIMTLEDPIEYNLHWIVQSEIQEKIWYNFDVWLKALLRQDPDIIMLWEIRDYETLNTAIQASLTGHLVLSTLHTKSAAETIDRMINMWLKPYILASWVDVIIAQRLVRRICPHCKKEIKKSEEEKQLISILLNEIWIRKIPIDRIKLFSWSWCEHCNYTWYKWRIGIYEILSFSDDIRTMIREWESSENIVKQAVKNDMISMKQDGILKAIKWLTTIQEVLRVI